MPAFSRREINVLLVIGAIALLAGLLMAGIGQRNLAREVGLPEYLIVLRNAGVTIAILSAFWCALALYQKNRAH